MRSLKLNLLPSVIIGLWFNFLPRLSLLQLGDCAVDVQGLRTTRGRSVTDVQVRVNNHFWGSDAFGLTLLFNDVAVRPTFSVETYSVVVSSQAIGKP